MEKFTTGRNACQAQRRKISSGLFLIALLPLSLSAWKPPVQTTPTLIIDDFEHWTSSWALQGWYAPSFHAGPSHMYLDSTEKHDGMRSMRCVYADINWAGMSIFDKFIYEIGAYDTMEYWIKGDGTGCGIQMLFTESYPSNNGKKEVWVQDFYMKAADKGKWVRAVLPKSKFRCIICANNVMDSPQREFCIFIVNPTGTGNHTFWIDDIAWIPKGPRPTGVKKNTFGGPVASVPVPRLIVFPCSNSMNSQGVYYDFYGRRVSAMEKTSLGISVLRSGR